MTHKKCPKFFIPTSLWLDSFWLTFSVSALSLLNLKNDEWGDKVTVISTDMRECDAPEKADILVSELLGSFGDNELSPECLDGAQKFLKDDGISIPWRSRSFVAPIQSYKIYSELKRCREYANPHEAPCNILTLK